MLQAEERRRLTARIPFLRTFAAQIAWPRALPCGMCHIKISSRCTMAAPRARSRVASSCVYSRVIEISPGKHHTSGTSTRRNERAGQRTHAGHKPDTQASWALRAGHDASRVKRSASAVSPSTASRIAVSVSLARRSTWEDRQRGMKRDSGHDGAWRGAAPAAAGRRAANGWSRSRPRRRGRRRSA